jgi:heme exporter protein CcmB
MAFRAFSLVLRRDLKIAVRRVSEWTHPLLFFIAVSGLFPLALSPDRLEMSAGEV